MSSLLVEHAPAAKLQTNFIEAAPVTMHVLAPARTLVEKLIIVHHAASRDNNTEQARTARHYYDIWCLLNDKETVEAISTSPVGVLAREVITFTTAAKMDTSVRPLSGFASSPAFDPAISKPARAAYESIVLEQLLWPAAPQPSFEDCCAAVHNHAGVL